MTVSVGGLLFRTHSEQRARASRGPISLSEGCIAKNCEQLQLLASRTFLITDSCRKLQLLARSEAPKNDAR